MAHPAAVGCGIQPRWETLTAKLARNDIWSDIEYPPIDNTRMLDYDVTFYDGNYYYFGGVSSSKILCLNGTSWNRSNLGQLNSVRSNHGVISVGNTFMVVGGRSTEKNEDSQKWKNHLHRTEVLL